MRRFSGVGARLGLALLVVLAGAMGLVYLIVVPSLENRLVNSRLSQLQRAADGLARELPSTGSAGPTSWTARPRARTRALSSTTTSARRPCS